jgi:hypothetical protein
VHTGPRGFVRSLQAVNAVTSLAREQLLQGSLDPPQTVLRKLFEKLGATYVKLGQVGWWCVCCCVVDCVVCGGGGRPATHTSRLRPDGGSQQRRYGVVLNGPHENNNVEGMIVTCRLCKQLVGV